MKIRDSIPPPNNGPRTRGGSEHGNASGGPLNRIYGENRIGFGEERVYVFPSFFSLSVV